MSLVHQQAWKHILREARRLREVRRDYNPTGVTALQEALKVQRLGYTGVVNRDPYVPLLAAAIKEPDDTTSC
jgi:hypothetical protein